MFMRKNHLELPLIAVFILGCTKPIPYGSIDYYDRQQFDTLESTTSLYSYGFICGFLKRYGEASPMNSAGWWHYGPYTLSDKNGRIDIMLKSPLGQGSTYLEIKTIASLLNDQKSVYLYFNYIKREICVAKNFRHLELTCNSSEADYVVSRTVACINVIYRSNNSSIKGQFGTLAR